MDKANNNNAKKINENQTLPTEMNCSPKKEEEKKTQKQITLMLKSC